MRFTRQAYPAFEALEWQVRLKTVDRHRLRGQGTSLSPLNGKSSSLASEHLELRWSEGSHAQPSDFRPNMERLMVGKLIQLRSFGGRSSDGVMPFFQLGNDQGGFIIAIGWSGDWEASFELKPEGRIAFHAGLQHANFRLRKDQEVRLPSVLLMRYAGPFRERNQSISKLDAGAFFTAALGAR
jgi:alpha-galactosidase